MTTTLDYDSLGRISQRYVAQGYSDYTYDGNTDWLARETWHAATSGNVFDLVRYWYANGRPSRVEAATVSNDLQTLNYYTTYYLEYNWHGDLTNYVTTDGIGGNNAIQWSDPWGQPMQTGPAWNYYSWDGGWGYLSFPSLGLYYVHGRWYNPDIGRFISPDAKGDYRYGSGSDATNWAWAGLQCQFWNNYSLGLIEDFQIPGQTYTCRDLEGNVYYFFGQVAGQSLSTMAGGIELVGGGGMFIGGGGATIFSGGALTGVSVPAVAGGAVIASYGTGVLIHTLTNPPILYAKRSQNPNGQPVNRNGMPYPSVTDPRTGRPIQFPDGKLTRVPQSQRVSWGLRERGDYIAEWYRRGYPTPSGGWDGYDIHHILPREFGGTNDFENLVPVARGIHQDMFNAFWRDY